MYIPTEEEKESGDFDAKPYRFTFSRNTAKHGKEIFNMFAMMDLDEDTLYFRVFYQPQLEDMGIIYNAKQRFKTWKENTRKAFNPDQKIQQVRGEAQGKESSRRKAYDTFRIGFPCVFKRKRRVHLQPHEGERTLRQLQYRV